MLPPARIEPNTIAASGERGWGLTRVLVEVQQSHSVREADGCLRPWRATPVEAGAASAAPTPAPIVGPTPPTPTRTGSSRRALPLRHASAWQGSPAAAPPPR